MKKIYGYYCKHCGQFFEAHNSAAKYCSNFCRVKAYRKRKGIPEPTFVSNGNAGEKKGGWKLF